MEPSLLKLRFSVIELTSSILPLPLTKRMAPTDRSAAGDAPRKIRQLLPADDVAFDIFIARSTGRAIHALDAHGFKSNCPTLCGTCSTCPLFTRFRSQRFFYEEWQLSTLPFRARNCS
jgi:hypothetical protein